MPIKYADHTAKLLTDPLDVPEAVLFAAWHDGQVVGTVRLNCLHDSDIGDYESLYNLATLSDQDRAVASISTRLMVRADFCGTILAAHLASAVYR